MERIDFITDVCSHQSTFLVYKDSVHLLCTRIQAHTVYKFLDSN